MRKPKKVSSSLNHRWFYSYRKPLKFLSRELSEKTHEGFISKPFKLSVVATIELLSRLFRRVALTICFDRFDWSLAKGYLVSTNMASFFWTHQAEKFNASNVILCLAELSNFSYKLLMLTEIIKWNGQSSLLFYSSFSFTWHFSRVYEKVNWNYCFGFLVLAGVHLLL